MARPLTAVTIPELNLTPPTVEIPALRFLVILTSLPALTTPVNVETPDTFKLRTVASSRFKSSEIYKSPPTYKSLVVVTIPVNVDKPAALILRTRISSVFFYETEPVLP